MIDLKAKRAITRVHGPSTRPYLLPPGTPKERVQILRQAFMDTVKEPELLAEAKKAKLAINPDGGAELVGGLTFV